MRWRSWGRASWVGAMTSERAANLILGGAAWALNEKGTLIRPYLHTRFVFSQLGRVMSGEVDRMMLVMPPRHGKTMAVKSLVATWLLHDPSATFGLSSYGSELSDDLSRDIRAYYDVLGGRFGEVERVSRWATASGGGLWAVGMGGATTGRGAATCLIADDILKGREEADSDTMRQRAWGWWRGTYRTRAEPGCRLIVIGTRWHDDDPLGRLLAAEKDEDREGWTIVLVDMEHDPHTLDELRAELPHNEIVGIPDRKPGHVLDMYAPGEVRRLKAAVGSREWGALYQGRPAPAGGLMFKEDDFVLVNEAPDDVDLMVRAWDFAATDNATSDRTAGVLMGVTGRGEARRWWLLDVVSGRWTPSVTRETVLATAKSDGREVHQVFEEEKGSAGKLLTQQLVTAIAPAPGHAVSPTGSKTVRATGLAAQVEAGNVRVLRAPWTRGFLDEIKVFPAGRHDDRTDAASHAFNWLGANEPGVSFADMLKFY